MASSRQRDIMIDEHAQDLLHHFARLLIFGISRDQDRLPTEMAPHALDRDRWHKFVEYVLRAKASASDFAEPARDAERVRVLLTQYGVTPEGATYWATEFRRQWERLEG